MSKRYGPSRGSSSPVGYSNPPREHQFKPGRSGNPSGRPRGSKSFVTLLDRELNRPIRVTEGGRQRVITKKEAAAKQFVNSLLRGDPAAVKLMLGISSHEAVPMDPEKDALVQAQIKKLAEILDEKAAAKAGSATPPANPGPEKQDKDES